MLNIVSNQWATRPADERFESLYAMGAAMRYYRDNAKSVVVSNRKLEVAHSGDNLIVVGPGGNPVIPTHWSFGQLAGLAGAPAGYLRKLHPALAADCVNYGLHVNRDVEEVGVLVGRNKEDPDRIELRAATGPNYGRIWNSDIVDLCIDKFGDGLTGRFRIPGEFGRKVEITKRNTTLYGSDRDMFMFLADEDNRVEMPDRRNGKTGSLARGFYITNSEVGSGSLRAGFLLFDFMCSNRIIWGLGEHEEIRLRHTSGAPDRWLEEVVPILHEMADGSARTVEQTLKAAKHSVLDRKVEDFLAARKFTKSQVAAAVKAHEAEEGRPMETIWDAVTGVTAAAKNVKWQDERVAMERLAGNMLDLVAA